MSMWNNYECEGQMSIFDILSPDTWSGKTSPEHSAATKERTSAWYLKKLQELRIKPPLFLDLRGGGGGQQAAVSWEIGGALLGAYTMHSFGEYPNEERGSRLSQILEDQPHQKYCLSAKACQGILRRAKERGKNLPKELERVLIAQSVSRNEQENPMEEKDFSYNMNAPEPCQQSTIKVYGVVSKGNGDAFIQDEKHTSLTTGGGEPGQGYPCVMTGINGSIVGTLDANYYKGCGERQGIEMEVVFTKQRHDEYVGGGANINIKSEVGNGFGDTVGALCAEDAKQIGNQYVNQGKCIIQNIQKEGTPTEQFTRARMGRNNDE